MNYDQHRPVTTGKNTRAHKCGASPVICLHSSQVANDGLWVKEEQGTAKQEWALQQPHICKFRTWVMINIDQLQLRKILVPINVVLLQSFASIPHLWQMMACGSKRNKEQQNYGGHCSTSGK
jgi:hypothetical protein